MEYTVECEVLADHPALPGHFPGYAVVPGVVILDQVLQALAVWQPGSRVDSFATVKFVSPLLPQQPFSVTLKQGSAAAVQFECRAGECRLALGLITLKGPA